MTDHHGDPYRYCQHGVALPADFHARRKTMQRWLDRHAFRDS